jgi:glycosyltransferase involved in cell wall biosynthesis
MIGASRQMKVVFDHQVFVTQAYGGVSRYFVELARELVQGREQVQIFAPAYVNRYLKAADPLHPLSFELQGVRRGIRYRPSVLSPLLWGAVKLGAPQILHETGYGNFNSASALAADGRLVSTVHDMTVERFPHYFDQPARRMAIKLSSLRKADAIICISESTRQDLLSFYPEFADRCHVVHHGVNQDRAAGTRPAELPSSYLLYVGTRQTYKNFNNLIRALGAAKGLPASLQLLCFGGGPLTEEEKQLCNASGWPLARVTQLAGDDALLAHAYKHAELFVFPSSYEGFGMPLTEAMVQACPIACARATSFPEVCQDAAEYFDPADSDDMARVIERLLADPARRRALAAAGQKRVEHFTWARCASETMAVYRDALRRRSRR